MEAGLAERPRSRGARAARSAQGARPPGGWARAGARSLLVALPAVLLLYLSFASGGFYPLTIALVGLVLGVALVVRITVAADPLEGFGAALAVTLGALAMLGAWMLASILWGAAPFRALLEFDRLLLYLVGVALVGSAAWSPRGRRWMVWLVVGGSFVVCALALASRLVPDWWSVGEGFSREPLTYPLGYTNAMGAFAGLGLVLAFHLTTEDRGPRIVRVLGAAALPVLASTLLLTFSRGAILATGFALVAYVLLGRPRGLVGGLLGAAPTLYAVSKTYAADLVAPGLPTTPAALAQGRELAAALVLAALVAAALRVLGPFVEAPLARVRMGRRTRLRAWGATGVVGLVALVVVVFSFDLPGVASRQYDRLVTGVVPVTASPQERLTAPGASGRFEEWSVALRQFGETPVLGSGAGSYQAVWAENRPTPRELRDAHSLYFEVASELGVVGLVLVVLTVGAVALGLLARCKGPDRALYAALAATWLGWAAHAGIDWDWEMPALTMPFLLMSAAGVASDAEPSETRERLRPGPARLPRVLAGLGMLALLVTPALVAISQVRVEASVKAWKQSDCNQTIDQALGSLDVLPVRTEPFELIGYCDARFGLADLAEGSMRSAIARDRHSWDLWYGLAMVQGANGRDPRPAMAEAARLNPMDPLVIKGVRLFPPAEPAIPIQGARLFRTDDPDRWARRARSARLPIP